MTSRMASYHTSTAWVTHSADLSREFRSMAAGLNRMRLDRSPFIPRTLIEYKALKEDSQAEAEGLNRAKHQQNEEDEQQARRQYRGYGVDWNDPKSFIVQRSIDRSQETIWTPKHVEYSPRPIADWPSPDEFKEEGDERHTSGYGRFLPIPRVPSNGTVAWKQKALMRQFALDQVHPVPRRYRVELPHSYEELLEPDFDLEGNAIDDPEESGRTATAGSLNTHTGILVQARNEKSPPESRNRGRRARAVSNLNPGVAEFVSQFNDSSGTTTPRQLVAANAFENQSSKTMANIQQGLGTPSNAIDNNPFSVLASPPTSTVNSPQESSTNQHLLLQDPHNSKLESMLPNFILEDEMPKSQSAEPENPKLTTEEVNALAIESVMRAWHIPTLDHIEQNVSGNYQVQPIVPHAPVVASQPFQAELSQAQHARFTASPFPTLQSDDLDGRGDQSHYGTAWGVSRQGTPHDQLLPSHLPYNYIQPRGMNSVHHGQIHRPGQGFNSDIENALNRNPQSSQELQETVPDSVVGQRVDDFTRNYFTGSMHTPQASESGHYGIGSEALVGGSNGIGHTHNTSTTPYHPSVSNMRAGQGISHPSTLPVAAGRSSRANSSTSHTLQDPIGTPHRTRAASNASSLITPTTQVGLASRNQTSGMMSPRRDEHTPEGFFNPYMRNIPPRRVYSQGPNLDEIEEGSSGIREYDNQSSDQEPSEVNFSDRAAFYGFGRSNTS